MVSRFAGCWPRRWPCGRATRSRPAWQPRRWWPRSRGTRSCATCTISFRIMDLSGIKDIRRRRTCEPWPITGPVRSTGSPSSTCGGAAQPTLSRRWRARRAPFRSLRRWRTWQPSQASRTPFGTTKALRSRATGLAVGRMALSLTLSTSLAGRRQASRRWPAAPDRRGEHERGGSREVRDRDGASALSRVPRRGRPVHARGRDGAAVLPDQSGRPQRPPGGQRGGLLRGHHAGRLGLGHVPARAVREECSGCYLQGRQRRRAGQERPGDSRHQVRAGNGVDFGRGRPSGRGGRPAVAGLSLVRPSRHGCWGPLTLSGRYPLVDQGPAATPELVHRGAGLRPARRGCPAGWRAEVVAVNPKDLLGQQGEQLAAKFLTEAGLSVLGLNWRCTIGEIDIVALDGRTLVVCEVKTRSGVRFGTPLEAITRQKAHRLRRLAVAWVRAHGLVFDQIRIDVIGVLRAASGEFSIEHVRGVG